MTYREKISVARELKIHIPDALASGKAIVGVYGFFAIKDEVEECFYIGKATNMAGRILGASDGHVYMYLQQNMTKFVPRKIDEYIKQGYRIEVRILEQIDYHVIFKSSAPPCPRGAAKNRGVSRKRPMP